MLTLLSAGVGAQIGRSAVAEIDPVHRVQREPPALPVAPAVRDVRTSPGSGCVNCNPYPEDYRPERDPQVEALYGEQVPVEEAGAPTAEAEAAAAVPVLAEGEAAGAAEQP
jgi:hypothetical protein